MMNTPINKTILALLLTLQTFTSKAATNPIEQGGFYRLENLKIAPKNAAQAALAIGRIGGHDFQCGATILSEEGYVATAMHCLKNCLFDKKTKKPLLKMNQTLKKGYYSGYEILAGETITCNLDFKRDNLVIFPSYQYSLAEPRIVWSGKGEHYHKEHLVADLTEQEFNSFKKLTEDVVILKYDDIQFYNDVPFHGESTTTLPCLKIETKNTAPGDLVWNIGYPLKNERLTYKGYGSVYSVGSILSSIEDDPIYKGYSKKIPEEKRKLFWEREKEVWNTDHILLSTTDAFSGNSGGAAVSEDGNLLGIVFGNSKSSRTTYEGATTFSYDAKALKRKVSNDLGKETAEKIFNCKSNL